MWRPQRRMLRLVIERKDMNAKRRKSIAIRRGGQIGRVVALACLGLSVSIGTAWAAPVATCQVEAGYSPEGDAEQLVLRTIGDARRSLRMSAYTFTSPAVVRQLLAAKRRGVDVAVVADGKGNTGKANAAALNLLVQAGIPVRTISAYAIFHDKSIVVDDETVETGSFNYSTAASKRNSENVVVISKCPALAQRYLGHWQSRWAQGVDYRLGY